MGLTEKQKLALALDKNISVTAGAGSGKTKILVERFLKIVNANPARVRQILAITFTKKAAGEMRERVAREINLLLESADAAERVKLLQVRDYLSQAAISTIHGFCSRVLREFPLEAGLSPDFKEMDEFESRVLRSEALDSLFEELDTTGGPEMAHLFNEIPQLKIRDALNTLLQIPYEMQRIMARLEELDENQWQNFLREHWLQVMEQMIFDPASIRVLEDLAREILANDTQAIKEPPGIEFQILLREFLDGDKNSADKIQYYHVLRTLCDHATGSKGDALKTIRNFGNKKSWSAPAIPLLLTLSAEAAKIQQRLKDYDPGMPHAGNDSYWYALFQGLLELYRRVREIYEQQKVEAGLVDFEDLQLKTLNLLQANEAVREKLSERFAYLMVDEFQDTNELQWAIVEYLAGGRENLQNKIFIVGDPKQSIYGFRDADIRVFKRVKEKFAADDAKNNIVFTDSFRFLPRLNAFINFVFTEILRERPFNPFEVGYDPLQALRDVPADSGRAELALLEDEQPDEEYIARRIRQLFDAETPVLVFEGQEVERPLEYGDIAVLLRSRNNLLKLELVLRNYGIPFKTVQGIGYWQRQEVHDFYHLLRFLSDPGDDFALVGVLRSPLFLISDATLFRLQRMPAERYYVKLQQALQPKVEISERDLLSAALERLRKWLEISQRIPLGDLLRIIIDDLQMQTLQLAQINGEQMKANIEKLCQQARRFEEAGMGGLTAFVQHLDDLIEQGMREGEAQLVSEDRHSVKIMTIHAAKGLQFPYVFVPYLNSAPKKPTDGILYDAELGMALKPASEDTRSSLAYQLLKVRRYLKEVAETRRLFYVALTRASNRLFLSAQPKKRVLPDSPLEWLHMIFPELADDTDRIENDDFTLDVLRALPEVTANPPGTDSFLKGLETLDHMLQAGYELPEVEPFKKLRPGADGRVFSPTRLMTFIDNPQEYYRRYHLGFFENDYEALAEDIARDEYGLLKGKVVHRYLELLPTWEESNELLVDRVLFEFEIFDPDLEKRFRADLRFFEQQIMCSAEGRDILFAETARNEVDITIKLGADYLTGTLDRIIYDKQDLWRVIDYKTNRISEKGLADEAKRYHLQMKAYALLLSKVYPGQDIYPVGLYFLQINKLYTLEFSKAELKAIEDRFIEIIEQIKTTFPVE